MPSSSSRFVRFGIFEVDLQEAELRKSGLRIKLQEQPFQILSMLLRRPGESVTREELRNRLWPADTFVDFDHSLNSSIKKLREALGDDSTHPRYIETLHRRGYRFIAPVDCSRAVDVEALAGILPAAAMANAERKKLALWKGWAGLAALFLAAVLVGFWLRPQLPPPRVVASRELTSDGIAKGSLATDGNRVYFVENLSDRQAIFQVSSKGGEPSAINVPIPKPKILDVSKDGSELLVANISQQSGNLNWTMWSVPIPAGSPRRLDDVSGQCGVWAPNGRLVYAKGNDFYIAEHDGANPRKFATAPPGIACQISFSPDGTRFRFTVKNLATSSSALWEARADGSDMHRLFTRWADPAAECCGYWTPEGNYYVFMATRSGSLALWMVREHSPWWRKNSRDPVQLTVGPLNLSNPLPSTDGKTLFALGTHPRAEMIRYDSKSGNFVPYLNGMSAGDLEFSRDGQWITYVTYPDRVLWRSKPDGSDRVQLTHLPMMTLLPHWSPDARQIAFTGKTPNKPWKIFLVSRDGGRLQALTVDEVMETDPTWSPDGGKLAFSHYDELHAEQTFVSMFDMNTHQFSELPDSRRIFGPRWSPDGRYLIAVSHTNQRLMLYDVKTAKWRELHSSEGQDGYDYLIWSGDSEYVYFNGSVRGENGFFRIRIADAKLEKIVDTKNIRLFPDGFAGSWCGLGPGNAPLFVRDITTQEIYALDLALP